MNGLCKLFVAVAAVAAGLKCCTDGFGTGAGARRTDFNMTGYTFAAVLIVNTVTGIALNVFDFVFHVYKPL
jgi:hypothetical protein